MASSCCRLTSTGKARLVRPQMDVERLSGLLSPARARPMAWALARHEDCLSRACLIRRGWKGTGPEFPQMRARTRRAIFTNCQRYHATGNAPVLNPCRWLVEADVALTLIRREGPKRLGTLHGTLNRLSGRRLYRRRSTRLQVIEADSLHIDLEAERLLRFRQHRLAQDLIAQPGRSRSLQPLYGCGLRIGGRFAGC